MNKKKVVFAIITIIVIIVMFYIKLNSKSPLFKIFDISILTISTGSMEPEIQIGEAVVIKGQATYEIGDIITYNVENLYLVTHRIVEKEGEDYITKGDNNNIKDKEKVSKESIEGKVIHHSKFMNYLMKFSPIIIIILLIIVLIFC